MRGWVVLGVLVLATATANAGAWYYKWSCAGACAPNQLAIRGVSSGYPSEEMCNDARWGDPRRHEFIGPGNLGGLTSCEEYDSEPSADDVGVRGSTRVIPTQRYQLAAIGGPGWRVRDGMTESVGDYTAGVELNLVMGARPWFGLEAGIGLQQSKVTAPFYGPDPETLWIVPLSIGLTSSPPLVRAKKLELRLDLGADFGFLFRGGCTRCDSGEEESVGFLGTFRAGIDTYFGGSKTTGLGIDGVVMLGQFGDRLDPYLPTAIEIVPPKFLIRVALLRRNGDLWW